MTLQGWTLPQTRHRPRRRSSRRRRGTTRARSSRSTSPPIPSAVAALLPAADRTRAATAAARSSSPTGARRPTPTRACATTRHAASTRRRTSSCYGTSDGKPVGRVPFIWVDNDLSLVRGPDPGLSEEARADRDDPAGRARRAAACARRSASRFAAHVSSLGRRLVHAERHARRGAREAVPRGHRHTARAHPAVARARTATSPRCTSCRAARSQGFELGTVFSGPATLELGGSEFEELDRLAPVAVGRGYVLRRGVLA